MARPWAQAAGSEKHGDAHARRYEVVTLGPQYSRAELLAAVPSVDALVIRSDRVDAEVPWAHLSRSGGFRNSFVSYVTTE